MSKYLYLILPLLYHEDEQLTHVRQAIFRDRDLPSQSTLESVRRTLAQKPGLVELRLKAEAPPLGLRLLGEERLLALLREANPDAAAREDLEEVLDPPAEVRPFAFETWISPQRLASKIANAGLEAPRVRSGAIPTVLVTRDGAELQLTDAEGRLWTSPRLSVP